MDPILVRKGSDYHARPFHEAIRGLDQGIVETLRATSLRVSSTLKNRIILYPTAIFLPPEGDPGWIDLLAQQA
jgi:hypothetical protein